MEFLKIFVNQYNNLEMVQTFVWPQLQHTAINEKYYFQQAVSTYHTATGQDKFLNKKMWPPRLPNLNPADFYLCSCLKTVIYNPFPKTLEDLMANIKREIKFQKVC